MLTKTEIVNACKILPAVSVKFEMVYNTETDEILEIPRFKQVKAWG